jgi:hypothetical protein
MTDRPFPRLSVHGDKDREERLTRLLRAYDTMGAIVRIVWPGEAVPRRDPAVTWAGAVARLDEAADELTVHWLDEDHREKFRLVAELAWAGLCESGRPVRHENADPGGSRPKPEPAGSHADDANGGRPTRGIGDGNG